ncbi:HET-domain-containing protein, partial [Lophiostoma macrostomum CBS 122681]
MTGKTTRSRFEHESLPDPATYIRLLEILEGDFDKHVACEVSTWPTDNTPSYYAISYTWGDPNSTSEITVNGERMTVRQNCEYVLQQAFTSKRSKYFWVDAICIDQESIQEKNHQVAIMDKIYKRAAHVFSCVG